MDKGLKHYRGIMQKVPKPAQNNKRAAKKQRRQLRPRKTNTPIIPMSELIEAAWGETMVNTKEKKDRTDIKNGKMTFKDHKKECKDCMTYNFCKTGLELLNSKKVS